VSDGIPLLGRIPAGPVTETGEEKTYVESIQDLLPMMKSEDYLLTVGGDSMREAGIEEGMTALIRPSVEPTDGDICAVWIDGDGGTLKRVYRHGETIQLLPENDHYDPMEVSTERVRIQGVLVAVFSIQTFRRH
jgi:repressor LexA